MSRRCDIIKGKKVMPGHTISHSNIKTNRFFLPNLKNMKFKSEILKRELSFKCPACTLRTVVKHGGIDTFLLTTRASHLTDEALKLKRLLRKKQVLQTAASSAQ